MTAHKIEDIKMKQSNSNNHDIRISLLEANTANISQTLIRLENKMDLSFERLDNKIDSGIERLGKKIDFCFERLDQKIDSLDEKMDAKLDKLNGRIWQLFLWGVGAFAAVLTLIAHVEKWI